MVKIIQFPANILGHREFSYSAKGEGRGVKGESDLDREDLSGK
jgi:hypothetical protein